jgi:hypothetical protein
MDGMRRRRYARLQATIRFLIPELTMTRVNKTFQTKLQIRHDGHLKHLLPGSAAGTSLQAVSSRTGGYPKPS